MELTLIVGRRALVEVKTALAGATLDSSFARSRSSMASFNFDKVPSRSVCCWEVVAIVGTRGSCKGMVWEVVRESPNPNSDGRSF